MPFSSNNFTLHLRHIKCFFLSFMLFLSHCDLSTYCLNSIVHCLSYYYSNYTIFHLQSKWLLTMNQHFLNFAHFKLALYVIATLYFSYVKSTYLNYVMLLLIMFTYFFLYDPLPFSSFAALRSIEIVMVIICILSIF